MPLYQYQARTNKGALVKDEAEANSPKELAQYLAKKGLILTSCQEADSSRKSKLNFLEKWGGVPLSHKIFFTQHLWVMLRAGFSLALALKTLESQTSNKKLKKIIKELYKDVKSGQNFHKSLAKYPNVFSQLFIHMIEAGELSGKLEEALNHLTIQMRKDYELRSKVKSALMYPAVVIVAMIVIGFLMMVFVIPRLQEVYAEAEAKLPLPTQILIGVANFVSHNLVFTLIGIALVIFLFLKFIKTKKGRYLFHKILLKFPILGGIIHKVNLARFARTLSSLLRTDIPIVKSFQVISRTLGNVLYQEHLLSVTKDLEGGQSIASVLAKRPDLFPPVVTQMVKIGEKSGSLDEVAEELAKFYENDVIRLTGNLATIIEPILIVLLGGAVALVALAVIMPMYSLVNQI